MPLSVGIVREALQHVHRALMGGCHDTEHHRRDDDPDQCQDRTSFIGKYRAFGILADDIGRAAHLRITSSCSIRPSRIVMMRLA